MKSFNKANVLTNASLILVVRLIFLILIVPNYEWIH